MVCLLVLPVTGCGAIGARTERTEIITVDTSCTRFRPVYVTDADILTDKTAEVILKNNEAGAAKCGWKRRTK